jgi:alanine or glycine:cation symporter, AGCS family
MLLNELLYNFLTILLLGVGFFFTWRFRLIQFRTLIHSIQLLWKSHSAKGISPFQAFSVGIASRVGTGTITGIAVALTAGGPGAIFWMWITALLGMASAFVEATLAQIFKQKNGQRYLFRGGPAYYIRAGLNSPVFSLLFAVAFLLCYGFVFNAVQANSIAEAFQHAFGFKPVIVGSVLVLLTAPVLFGGIRRVSRFSQIVIPFIAISYLGLTSYVIIQHASSLLAVIKLIFESAFGLTPIIGGAAGYSVHQAMVIGIKRGLFANEAGMGSAPNAAATATTTHPVTQGLLQMLGVAIDTLVVCTATALMILVSGEYTPGSIIEGAALTQRAIATAAGPWAGVFMTVAIFLFAWTTIIGNYAYAEGNLQFLSEKKSVLHIFRIGILLTILLGTMGSLSVVWDIADTSMALMASINLIAIVLLTPYALAAWKDYRAQRKTGQIKPRFYLNALPHPLLNKLPKDVWPKE